MGRANCPDDCCWHSVGGGGGGGGLGFRPPSCSVYGAAAYNNIISMIGKLTPKP